jgi:hypothetical protein
VPDKALMTVHSASGPPTLEAAAAQLGVGVDAVDTEFGVVLVDPRQGLYSVQVDATRLPPDAPTDDPYRGPFSNPPIDTFGPPRDK